MAEDTHAPDAEPPAGVFGNLPASRPGTRSPRRGSAGPDQPAADTKREAAAAPDPDPVEAPPEPPPAPAPPRGTRPATPERIGGIEDLAWAGVAVAAQAATLGIRAASRALDAVRKPSGPSQ
jgi:hypothetical protein